MLKTVLVPGQTFLESCKTYVGFTDDSSAALLEIHPQVAPRLPAIIDDFYATIEAHPGARAAITGGNAQIQRLKRTLLAWLEGVFQGPHDEAYFERRARIGRIHVQISLPQAYMFTAMDRIRVRTVEALREVIGDATPRLARVVAALRQILDIELAIMLETYREDLLAKHRTAERLSTIGQFAAGIGHELRNPLGVMESSVFLMRQRLRQLALEDAVLAKHLDKVAAEVQRSNKTINDLLELARNRPPKRRVVEVKAVVDQAVAAAVLPAGVTVETDLASDLRIDCDPDQIGRVLSNLFINASQAMDGRGRIRVEARRADATTTLRIRDDGPGVASDVRHRIFEALFTTKAKGSGLGLALCRQIAQAHRGTMILERNDGEKGASFLLTVPDSSAEGTEGA